MNAPPSQPELLQRLAADYVLGTMRGGARRRLERWREQSADLDGYCLFWEQRLMPLVLHLRPLDPPPSVWPRIQQRLAIQPQTRSPRRVRALAWAASLLLIIGASLLVYWWRLGTGPAIETATISAPQGMPIWEIQVRGRRLAGERMTIRTGSGAAPPAGRAYELWALPSSGNPVSLGVLPVVAGSTVHTLTPAQQQALERAPRVAVSIEPVGGSRTGQPTGTIAFVTALSHTT